MCIDVMVVNMVMIFLELFATETREKRFTKASFVVIGPNWYILVIPNPSFDWVIFDNFGPWTLFIGIYVVNMKVSDVDTHFILYLVKHVDEKLPL